MVLFCREHGKALSVTVHAQPKAKKTEIIGVHGEALKIKVAAPPVDGAANDELIRFFAQLFDVSKSQVRLKQGSTGRKKVVEVEGATAAQLTEILLRQGLLTIKFG